MKATIYVCSYDKYHREYVSKSCKAKVLRRCIYKTVFEKKHSFFNWKKNYNKLKIKSTCKPLKEKCHVTGYNEALFSQPVDPYTIL